MKITERYIAASDDCIEEIQASSDFSLLHSKSGERPRFLQSRRLLRVSDQRGRRRGAGDEPPSRPSSHQSPKPRPADQHGSDSEPGLAQREAERGDAEVRDASAAIRAGRGRESVRRPARGPAASRSLRQRARPALLAANAVLFTRRRGGGARRRSGRSREPGGGSERAWLSARRAAESVRPHPHHGRRLAHDPVHPDPPRSLAAEAEPRRGGRAAGMGPRSEPNPPHRGGKPGRSEQRGGAALGNSGCGGERRGGDGGQHGGDLARSGGRRAVRRRGRSARARSADGAGPRNGAGRRDERAGRLRGGGLRGLQPAEQAAEPRGDDRFARGLRFA